MQIKQFLIKNSLKWVIIVSFLTCVRANPDAKRLYDDLLSNYNRLIRPVSNNTDTVLVKLGLRLSQLIDLVSDNKTSQTFNDASRIELDVNVNAQFTFPRTMTSHENKPSNIHAVPFHYNVDIVNRCDWHHVAYSC